MSIDNLSFVGKIKIVYLSQHFIYNYINP